MWEELIRQYGYWMIFGGTIFQGDATIIAAGFLAHRGYLDVALAGATALTATLVESTGYFELARRNRARSSTAMPDAMSARVAGVLSWLDRRGSKLILIARFLPGLRLAISLACGASGMPRSRFFSWNLAGSIVWVAVMEGLGYSGGEVFASLVTDVKRHEWTVAIIVVLAVVLLVESRTRGRVVQLVITMARDPRAAISRSIDRLSTAVNSSKGILHVFRLGRNDEDLQP